MKSLFLSSAIVPVRRLMYAILRWVDHLYGRSTSVVVLCYHSAANDGGRFSMAAETIERQLSYLLQTRTPVSLQDVVAFVRGEKTFSEPVFAVTFDDGFTSLLHLRHLAQVYGIRPTVFLLVTPEKANRGEIASEESFLTTQEVTSLVEAGWEIGCHSATHAYLPDLTPEEIEKEVSLARTTLEQSVGQRIPYFAYPKGGYTPEVVEAVKAAGFEAAFSMDDTVIRPGVSRFTLPRVGVDKTHNLREFKALWSPAVISLRGWLKH